MFVQFLNRFASFILIVSVWISCSGGTTAGVPEDSDSGYDLSSPNQVFPLPSELREVSGISFADENTLACIQDERGLVFLFDIQSGRVTERVKFWKDGDYEDVEVIDQDCYVLKSNGTLFRIRDFRKANPRVDKITTPLCEKNDVEGLTYHKSSGSLWLACKASAKLCESKGSKRAVYSFQMKKEKLLKEPVVELHLKRLEEDLNNKRIRDFSPSGIAIHPITNDIYMISSVGKQMIILSSKKEFKTLHSLNFSNMRQPEGICFAANGDLYISNEGKSGGAVILFYKYQPQK